MNPKPMSEAEAIRSDIETTRRRMDDTIEALSERVRGRHLLDEVIGFFRHNGDTTSETGARVREKVSEAAGKISESAGSAASAVVDTVKKNPLPILMITAGAAWLAYSMTRGQSADVEEDIADETEPYDPDMHYDQQLEYPESNAPTEGMTDEADSTFAQLKNKAMSAKDQVKEKLSGLSETARDKFESVKNRAGEFGSEVQDRTRELYGQARDRVARTADEYPVELGLGCLAVGILAGLALPTPEPVNRFAGPTVNRLRNRTKDAGRGFLEKGKRVVQAASNAAKQEAQAQGLTIDRLRRGGEAVAQRAGEAASDTARQEGMTGDTSQNERAGTDPADPSAARPAM